MEKKYKIILASFLLSLPFWWFVNVASSNFESFWFLKNLPLSANIENSLAGLRQINESKTLANNLSNLKFSAKSVLVLDENQSFLDKNSQRILPIASLSKLTTALVVSEMSSTYKNDPDLSILLNKMLLESDNDSANELANYIGTAPFVELMNYYVKKNGLSKTSFINPSGLDDDVSQKANLSTAQDLAKLADYILKKYPEIFKITVSNKELSTSQELLNDYSEIIGVKTGQTAMAGECLLVIMQKPNSSDYYINIILGSNDRFGEMREILDAELNK